MSPASPGDGSSAIPELSSRMTPAQVEACLGALPDLQLLQPPLPGTIVQPHWGLFREALGRLSPSLRERIRAVVHLADPGDLARPEKTLVRLAPADHVLSLSLFRDSPAC